MTNKESVTGILNYALKGSPLKEDTFSADFIQIINGRPVTLEEFHRGTAVLRQDHPIIELTILSMAASGECVHSHHLVATVNQSNEKKRFEVFARYDFVDGKAVGCFESLRELNVAESIDVFFPLR